MTNIVWSPELAAAVAAIASDDQEQDEFRLDLAQDVRDRAHEFNAWAQVGIPLTDLGMGLMQQLRSRLADPCLKFSAAAELERAWSVAYNAEQPAKILASSWGYDQTNVEFYRVEQIKGEWITLQKIAAEEASDGCLTMTGQVVPAEPHRPIGEPFRRKVFHSCGELCAKIKQLRVRPAVGRQAAARQPLRLATGAAPHLQLERETMNQDLRSSFASAVGGREAFADSFNARTMRDTRARADRELDDAADTVAGAYAVIDKVAAPAQIRRRRGDRRAQGRMARPLPRRLVGVPARRRSHPQLDGDRAGPLPGRSQPQAHGHRAPAPREMIAIANGVGAWARKRIRRIQREQLGPVGCADHELENARRKLAARECRQSMMRAVNAAIRKHKTKPDAIARISAELEGQGCPVEASLVPELLKPDYAGRIGFASYQLSNNNAEIHRLRDRVAVLERRAAAVHSAAVDPAEDPPADVDQVRIVENALEQRVQIFFPDKPSSAVRDQLKGRGFRWAPSAGAWQRQLTSNAIAAARAIVKQSKNVQ
jgi:hypothetical protein